MSGAADTHGPMDLESCSIIRFRLPRQEKADGDIAPKTLCHRFLGSWPSPPARLGGTAPRAAAGLPQAVELGEGKLPELHEPLADSRIAATRTCADGRGTTAHVKQARTRTSRKKSIFKLQIGSTLGLRRCGGAFLGRDEVRQTEAQKEQREPRRGWSRLQGHAPEEENPGAISDLCAVVLPRTNTGSISNPFCKSHEPCSLDLGPELSRVWTGTTDIDPQTSRKRKDMKRRQHDRQADMTRTP